MLLTNRFATCHDMLLTNRLAMNKNANSPDLPFKNINLLKKVIIITVILKDQLGYLNRSV